MSARLYVPTTMTPDELARAVAEVQDALYARDLAAAKRAYLTTIAGSVDRQHDLVMGLGRATVLPSDAVVWGFMVDLFSNPFREGYGARCGMPTGNCYMRGWVNYRTERGARDAAVRHADEHAAKGWPVPRVVSWHEEEGKR